MAQPWNDWVTASIDKNGARDIVAEGPLRTVVVALAERNPGELRRILLAFPDRRRPPYRIDGDRIPTLARQLEDQERVALWAKGQNAQSG